MDDPSKQLKEQMQLEFEWVQFNPDLMKPTDLTGSLERHASKKYPKRSLGKIKRVVIHCSDRDWSIDQLVEYDVKGKLTYTRKVDGEEITDVNHISSSGLPGITYHDMIMPDGFIYHTLPYNEASYHAAGYNRTSVALGLMIRVTNPATGRDEFGPTDYMLRSTWCRAGDLCLKFGLPPQEIYGHRELEGTGFKLVRGKKRLQKTCPGLKVDLDLVRRNAAKYMQIKLLCAGHYQGDIDGLFGPKSKKALSMWKDDGLV